MEHKTPKKILVISLIHSKGRIENSSHGVEYQEIEAFSLHFIGREGGGGIWTKLKSTKLPPFLPHQKIAYSQYGDCQHPMKL